MIWVWLTKYLKGMVKLAVVAIKGGDGIFHVRIACDDRSALALEIYLDLITNRNPTDGDEEVEVGDSWGRSKFVFDATTDGVEEMAFQI